MSSRAVEAAVALGSNLGDRRAFLESALASIARTPGVKLLARGPIREYPPLTKRGAKLADVGGPYLNSACVIRTTLDAHQLLARLLHIERDHHRVRSETQPWAARTLDLDLLLFDADAFEHDTLIIPHPRMHQRRFVLEPLAAIAPDWLVPGFNRSVAELLVAL